MTLSVSLTAGPDPTAAVARLTVRDDLDVLATPELTATFDDLVAGGCRSIHLDLSQVTFVDAGALGALAVACGALRTEGGALVFTEVSALFQRIATLTRLHEAFGLS